MPRRIASPPIACDRGGDRRSATSIVAAAILLAAGACSERPAATAPIDWTERSRAARRPAEGDRPPAPPEASGDREPAEPVQPASPAQPVASSSPAGEPAGSSAGGASAGSGAAATDGDPGDAESTPAPALPGRGPRRPALPAEQAAEFAKASLGRARTALRGGDAGAAADLALEAYDAVAPHAAASRQCGALCADAGKLLESIARKQGPAADQPTRFD